MRGLARTDHRNKPGPAAKHAGAGHNRPMDRYERILSLHRILKTARYPVTVARLRDELECSRATVYRDLAFLRDGLMAQVVGDGDGGFRYRLTGGAIRAMFESNMRGRLMRRSEENTSELQSLMHTSYAVF